MNHRREIDGLRAVAVLPVLFSHAGVPFFAGGFVGVDVFFVISGFLITGILLSELDDGRFSIMRFYERRTRRILPALFAVMFASLVVGWFLMSADAYQNLGQSVVATTLFSNNVLLTLTSGYWDMESRFKPLLHTWSLGVEEQYYMLVPLVLMLVHRFLRRHVRLAIAVIAVASFAISLWAMRHTPEANFYLLHTRAWELAVGGLAVTIARDRTSNSDLLAMLGLAMILVTVVALPEGTQSPSPMILPPVIGTALILLYCRSGYCHALLSSRAPVAIGLISYSLYLWHQPLFAFLRVASPVSPPLWQYLLMILASLALAWASWRFIELPFRNRALLRWRTVLLILASAAAALVAVGVLLHVKGGVPARFDQAPGAEPAAGYKPFNMAVFRYKQPTFPAGAERRLLVLGNSTARDFVNIAEANGHFRSYAIVYRDDLDPCEWARLDPASLALVRASTLIVKVYSQRRGPICDGRELARNPLFADRIVFFGPKDFGVNLNPVARLPLAARPQATVLLSDDVLAASRLYRGISPPDRYVDVIGHLSPDGRRVPIFDEGGRILSEDRVHVTRAGARFLGARVFNDPVWARVEQIALARQAHESAGR